MFARLHPLIVHIPIGFIVVAALAGWLLSEQRKAVRFVWLLAAGSAVLACITGYLLSNAQQGYDAAAIQQHQYLNMGLTLACAVQWWISGTILSGKHLARTGLLPLLLLMWGTFTGARITHGNDFLQAPHREDAWDNADALMPSNDIPKAETTPANPEALAKARQRGLVIMPVGQESNWLSVNCVNVPGFSDADAALLAPIAEQIVWLRLSDSQISDQGLAVMGKMKHLTRLYLDHTKVSGSGLAALQGLEHLTLLSLSGTPTDVAGLGNLPVLPALKKVFLYQTPVGGQDISALTARLGPVHLDTGGYAIPLIAEDTARLKAKASY